MRRYIEGVSRQGTLFPDHLEDWIDDENVVRVIDAFVASSIYSHSRICRGDGTARLPCPPPC